MSVVNTTKPVIISGAGLGGLLLARSLQANRIPFLVYERDATSSSRSQGYRIRISSQGLDALSSVLPADKYQQFRGGCSDNKGGGISALNALTMAPVESPGGGGGGGGGGPPRGGGEVLGVGRGFLRRQLSEGIEDAVHFGKNVVGYDITAEGVVARFPDGSRSPEGALLVGADGVYSHVAGQLTGGRLKVYDTGARMIHGSSPRSAFAGLSGAAGLGAFSLQDETNPSGKVAMITNVRDEQGDDVHFGWVLVGEPGTFEAPNNDFSVSGQPAVDISTRLTAKWSDVVRPILTEQKVDEAAFLKMSTSSPDGVPEWANESRVTLLGDAVHAMTPAGGVGANSALRDAELLGRLMSQKGGWSADLTAEYEKEMRVYASQNVKDSWETAQRMFKIKELNKPIR